MCFLDLKLYWHLIVEFNHTCYQLLLKLFRSATYAMSVACTSVCVCVFSPQELKELAVRCMCSLLMSHSHFNYRSDIIMFLIPLMAHANTKVCLSILCCTHPFALQSYCCVL